jgi:hypothetical protein
VSKTRHMTRKRNAHAVVMLDNTSGLVPMRVLKTGRVWTQVERAATKERMRFRNAEWHTLVAQTERRLRRAGLRFNGRKLERLT